MQPAGVRLGAEIAWTTLRVRRLVHRNDLPTALDRCRTAVHRPAPVPSRDDVVRISRAVRRTIALLPGTRGASLHPSSSSPFSVAAASSRPSSWAYARTGSPVPTRGSRSTGYPRRPRRRTSSHSSLRCEFRPGVALSDARTPAAERAGGLARSSRRGGSTSRGGTGARRSVPPRRGSRHTTGPPGSRPKSSDRRS